MPSLPLILLLLTVGQRVSAWNNGYDEPLYVVCPSGSAVYQIASQHDDHHEDRVWKIRCKSAVEFSDCYWSGRVNDYDQAFDFECRPNYVMTGMSSHHHDHYEDRRWEYLCCTGPELTLSMCMRTPEINYWDGYLNWQVPGDKDYVTGAASRHDDHYEDRRWSFRYCTAN